ncbi:MAG TPA: hypothetical protein VK191_14085 [Symbiobacteriaceae bacterium]|nr:hypothetical protein [Symbiobacteriaceae bacterium]
MTRVRDLVSLLTATGVAIGRSNGGLTLGNLPTILQTCEATVNLFAPIRVSLTADTLLLEEPDSLNLQILSVLGLDLPSLSITATYIAVPSLVPVPPT